MTKDFEELMRNAEGKLGHEQIQELKHRATNDTFTTQRGMYLLLLTASAQSDSERYEELLLELRELENQIRTELRRRIERQTHRGAR